MFGFLLESCSDTLSKHLLHKFSQQQTGLAHYNISIHKHIWAHINNLFFETFYGELKKLSKKLVIFSFFYKLFFKNNVLIYALRAHVSKIQHTIQINHLIIKKKKKKKLFMQAMQQAKFLDLPLVHWVILYTICIGLGPQQVFFLVALIKDKNSVQ